MKKMIRRRAVGTVIVGCVLTLAGLTFAEAGERDGTFAMGTAGAQSKPKLARNLAGLKGPFDLAGERNPETCYYIQETQYISMGFDGKRKGIDTYTVKMRMVPAALSKKAGDEYTVREFSVKLGGADAETIPALAGWSYVFNMGAPGMDGKGQVFGIPHEKFEDLTTSSGGKLSGPAAYPVYNSFIDFHSYCDIFARPWKSGSGVQDLKEPGQSIRHASAFSVAPVNLGKGIKEGSVFRNGEIRLTFKGIGLVDGAACAIIGYDSGESSLKMIMPMSADKDIIMEGGSEYLGDICIDLETRWVRRATLDEFVVSLTRVPAMGPGGQGTNNQSYTVRHILTRMVSREEYER